MDNKIATLKEALVEVRKAHRLVESFQERMLSLVSFIRAKLDFPQFDGVKHFSNPIYSHRNGSLRIQSDMWAWDFLYSYLFEYYVGCIDMDDDSKIFLSIIQYADTGYFDSSCEDRTAPLQFASVEESSSKLLFFMEQTPKGCKSLWDEYKYTERIVLNKDFGCTNHKETVLEPKGPGKNKFLLYSIPIERFADEKSSIAALKDYVAFLEKNYLQLSIV